jgi:quercetin dioxygenase-like cupin family protein
MKCRVVLVMCAVLALAAMAAAQDMGSMPMVANTGKLMFGNLPNIPACAKGAGLHGDPMKGAFVLEIKATAGCVVPMHWHSSNEQVGLIIGMGSLAMPKAKPQAMSAGSYVYLPAKGVHSFTCKTACTFFLAGDAAFDIHYVDESGKEIPAEQALKAKPAGHAAVGKSSGAQATPKKK